MHSIVRLTRAFGRFAASGFSADTDPDKLERVQVVTVCSALGGVICLVFALLRFSAGLIGPGLVLLGGSLAALAVWIVLRRTRRLGLSSIGLMLIAFFLFLYLISWGSVAHTGLYWSFLFPLAAFFLTGERNGVWLTVFFFFAAALLLLTPGNPLVMADYEPGEKLRFFVALLSIALISYYYERGRNRARAKLKQYSEELERAKQGLEEASRNKSEFLANMSHELRTPLNAIIGFADVLLEKLNGQVEHRLYGFLGNVRTSGHHLLGLINAILDLSKVEAGMMEVELEQICLADLIDGVQAVIAGSAGQRDISFTVQTPDDLPTVTVDAAKLKQILFNLLANAVRFSPDGGEVQVRTRVLRAIASPLEVESYEIAVRDHGPGMAEENTADIFEPFSQIGSGAARRGGTGLGLSIVRQFVGLLGGAVGVESQLGQGSTFWVILPVEVNLPE